MLPILLRYRLIFKCGSKSNNLNIHYFCTLITVPFYKSKIISDRKSDSLTAWKVFKYGFISGLVFGLLDYWIIYFPVFGLNVFNTVLNPNRGKDGAEINPYLVTFHAAPNTSRSTIILLEFLLLQYNLTLNRKNTFFIKPFLPQHWCNRKYVQNSYLTVSWRRYLDWFLYDKDLCHETFNPIMPGVHKIVRHTLKILQNLLKDF